VKIALQELKETLLIPLYARARMSRAGLIRDDFAERTVRELEYPFEKLKIRKKTEVMLALRALAFDRLTQEFLQQNPGSTVVYLGCGLDSRAARLGYPAEKWYDLDFPEVVDIKRRLIAPTEKYRMLGCSATDGRWLAEVETDGRPVLVLAEGLMMYLSEAEAAGLIAAMKRRFGDVTFIFDAFSGLTAGQMKRHPSLKSTGAGVQSGFDSPSEIERLSPGVTYQKTVYLTDRALTARLGGPYRLMFAMAGAFKAAREAHRIFVFRLKNEG